MSEKPKSSTSAWVEFWRREDVYRKADWVICQKVFSRAIETIWRLRPTDRVLDVGCGPGYIAELLRGRVRSVCGLDISARYVEECRRKFRDVPGWEFFELPPDYLDFRILDVRRFDRILCFSVVQYYRSLDEVLRLVDEVERYAAPGALLLLGDMAFRTGHGILRSSMATLRKSLSEGFFWKQLAFLSRASRSSFLAALKEQGYLEFSPEDVSRMREALSRKGLPTDLHELPLALKENRFHLLVHYGSRAVSPSAVASGPGTS